MFRCRLDKESHYYDVTNLLQLSGTTPNYSDDAERRLHFYVTNYQLVSDEVDFVSQGERYMNEFPCPEISAGCCSL